MIYLLVYKRLIPPHCITWLLHTCQFTSKDVYVFRSAFLWVKETEKWRDVWRSHQRNAIILYDGLDVRIFCITIKVKLGIFAGTIFEDRLLCGDCKKVKT